jgi:hypothetical protein
MEGIMRHFKFLSALVLLSAVIITSVNLVAKVSSVRDLKRFDNYVSAEYIITIVLAYTQPKKMDSDGRRAIREAERGFRDASDNNIHKKIKMKFVKVNLDRIPELVSEYNLSKDQNNASIVLFKRGRHVATAQVKLKKDSARNAVYNETKDAINDNFGSYIDNILQEIADLEADIAVARASAPRYDYNPFYSSWWDHSYHGYYHPYHHRYYHRPGFGFHINLD